MSHMEPIQTSLEQLGAALKDAMATKQITQTQVSTLAGIPRNSLNRKINGDVFNFDELVRIARVLHRPLSTIIADAERIANHPAPALANKEAE